MNEALLESEVITEEVVTIAPKRKTKKQLAKIRSDAGRKAAATRQANEEARKQQEFELSLKRNEEARKSNKRKVAILTLIGISAEVVSQFAGYGFWASMHNGSIAVATMVVLGLLWQVLFFYGGFWSKVIGFFGVLVLAGAPCYQVAQPYIEGLSKQESLTFVVEDKSDIDRQIAQKEAFKASLMEQQKVLTNAGRVSKDPAAVELRNQITGVDADISKLYTQKSDLTKKQADADQSVDMENKKVNMWLRVSSIIVLSVASMVCMSNAGKARRELNQV